MEREQIRKKPWGNNRSILQKAGGNQTALQLIRQAEEKYHVPMEDVTVHFNSSMPRQYGAYAYAQGNDVHIGPGQEKYLSHELGHVIQQKLGKVAPTSSVAGEPLNDDPALEHEADRLLAQ